MVKIEKEYQQLDSFIYAPQIQSSPHDTCHSASNERIIYSAM
jgi:hypothetical protein